MNRSTVIHAALAVLIIALAIPAAADPVAMVTDLVGNAHLSGGSAVELLDEVWGLDFDGDPNVVEVYVGYLRRKIDTPFDRRTLETVRGAGYRLVSHG